jgi:hypothetical protein
METFASIYVAVRRGPRVRRGGIVVKLAGRVPPETREHDEADQEQIPMARCDARA